MKSDLLIHSAAQLLTAPPGREPLVGPGLDRPWILDDGAVACAGGKVVAVGRTADVLAPYPERDAARVIDASGLLVTPGFVDCHTHLPFAGTREMEFEARARGESYEAIAARGGGIQSSVAMLRETSEDVLVEKIRRRLTNLLAEGTTTVEAKSGYGLSGEAERKQLRALRTAAARSPLAVIPTFLGAHEVPDEYRDDRAAYVKLLTEEMIPGIARERLALFCDVFCDRGVFTIDEARAILRAGSAHGLRPKLHADELADVGAAALAAEVKAVSADHLLHASDTGLRAMRDAGTIAVLLPGTAFTLGLPYARARDMIAMGLPIALATDWNPGSTMSSSMPLALTLAVTQMRLTPAQAWMAATANAAAAVGEGSRTGRIQPGYRADLCVFCARDYRHIPYHYGHNHALLTITAGFVAHDRSGMDVCG